MAQVLSKLPSAADPNIIVGLSTSDDAAVYRVSDDLAIVFTADFFTPIVDDPYDFGRIAVTNALSDIYAMGGMPAIALNLTAFPAASLPAEILEEILRGGTDQASKAGVSIVGGHSIDDREPKYGLAVVGFVHPDKVISNAAAKPGDTLVLTKPIGTGVISTAIKKEAANEAEISEAVKWMTTLNKDASVAMQKTGVNACTDITGFGLLGHLYEMLSASRVDAVVNISAVPVISGVRNLLAQDMAPGGAYRNLSYLESREAVLWDGEFTEEDKLLLNDPQTAGGLLISVEEEKLPMLAEGLKTCGVPAAVIGRITSDGDGKITVTSV